MHFSDRPVVLATAECQTEWSWLEDMTRIRELREQTEPVERQQSGECVFGFKRVAVNGGQRRIKVHLFSSN